MDNLEYIKSVYSKGINCEKKREACIANAVDIKMSRGNSAYGLYGMFPPDEKVYILLHSRKFGHLTKREKGIDNKYYFDSKGKVMLMETFSPHSEIGCDKKPALCTFFEYNDKIIDIVVCRKTTDAIGTVARCEFDNEGKLIRYLEGSGGDDLVIYNEMLYRYEENFIYVTYTVLGENYKSSPTSTTSVYKCCDGKIVEQISN